MTYVKGLVTLERPNHEVIVAAAEIAIDTRTHMAALTSNVPVELINGAIRMSVGFMYYSLSTFIPSIPFDCCSFEDAETICFEVNCDELYVRSLGKRTVNNYTRIYSEFFTSRKRGNMLYAED